MLSASWCLGINNYSILIPLADNANRPVVSKSHFRIYSIVFDSKDPSVQPLIYCEDLESVNGTYVNGLCIGRWGQEKVGYLLCHGDFIEVCPQWRFQLHQPAQYPTGEVLGQHEDIAVSTW